MKNYRSNDKRFMIWPNKRCNPRSQVCQTLGAIYKLLHTNFKIFYPLYPPLSRWSHFWDRHLVWVTYFAIVHLEIIKLRVGATSNCAKWTLNVITYILVKLFNAFQWNCFNLVYTCNIALILFLKCDVTKFRIPPPPCHTLSTLPLTCDVVYGRPLTYFLMDPM